MPDAPVTSGMVTPMVGQYPTSSASHNINSNADYTPDGDYDDGSPMGVYREQLASRGNPRQPQARQPQQHPIIIPSGFLSQSPLVRRVPVHPEQSAMNARPRQTKKAKRSPPSPKRFSLFGW
jgi:hypothetical protein